MNLREQLYVCTLADTGNLTKAANLLFISQPALSLFISNLENRLGVRLFNRVGKEFVPTFAGDLYLEKARPMLKLKKDFNTELSEMLNGQNERLRVGMQDIRSQFLTPQILPKIVEMFPQTKFYWDERNYGTMEKMLLDNQLDIFFCNCTNLRKEFEYIPLYGVEVVFLVPKSNPLTANAQIKPGFSLPWIDLSLFENERFILQSDTQSLRNYSNQILKACNCNPKNIFVLRNIYSTISVINQGFGVGFSQMSYINWRKDLNNINIYSVIDPPLTATFYAIYKKSTPPPKSAFALIEMIKSILEKQVSDMIEEYYSLPNGNK